MDEYELRGNVYDYIKEISHYSQMQVFATSSYQKKYFQLQIDETTDELMNLIQTYLDEAARHAKSYSIQLPPEPEEQKIEFEEDVPIDGSIPMLEEEMAPEGLREITKEELSDSNGSGGKPAYVAVDGNVYDVSKVGKLIQ